MRVKNCRATVGSQFLPRGIKMSRRALWEMANLGNTIFGSQKWTFGVPLLEPFIDTEYDRANVPPYNGNDPPPAPGSLKLSGTGDSQRGSRESIRANHSQLQPHFYSV